METRIGKREEVFAGIQNFKISAVSLH